LPDGKYRRLQSLQNLGQNNDRKSIAQAGGQATMEFQNISSTMGSLPQVDDEPEKDVENYTLERQGIYREVMKVILL
jgi:hypothetical protein